MNTATVRIVKKTVDRATSAISVQNLGVRSSLMRRTPMQSFRNILFGADFSENSQEAFRAACSLATANKTRLVVLHVAEPNLVPEVPAYYGQQSRPVLSRHARRGAARRARAEVARGLHARRATRRGVSGQRGRAIEGNPRGGQAIGSDMIVVGTHGRTGLRWLLAGSVAASVVHGAPCPVLAVRSAEHPCPARPIAVDPPPHGFLGPFRSRAAGRARVGP